jgi:hypothetical protein
MSLLGAQKERFFEHDLFLQALLGVRASASRVRLFFERAAAQRAEPEAAPPKDDVALMVLLGVLSFQRCIEGALTSACDDNDVPKAPPTAPLEGALPPRVMR